MQGYATEIAWVKKTKIWMCEQTVNAVFAPEMGQRGALGRWTSLDRTGTLIYNKRINIRAFADRSGLLAMALFLTVDLFYMKIYRRENLKRRRLPTETIA